MNFPKPIPLKAEYMDLRDYFAAKAMESFITKLYGEMNAEKIVMLSYSYANLMMKAREQ